MAAGAQSNDCSNASANLPQLDGAARGAAGGLTTPRRHVRRAPGQSRRRQRAHTPTTGDARAPAAGRLLSRRTVRAQFAAHGFTHPQGCPDVVGPLPSLPLRHDAAAHARQKRPSVVNRTPWPRRALVHTPGWRHARGQHGGPIAAAATRLQRRCARAISQGTLQRKGPHVFPMPEMHQGVPWVSPPWVCARARRFEAILARSLPRSAQSGDSLPFFLPGVRHAQCDLRRLGSPPRDRCRKGVHAPARRPPCAASRASALDARDDVVPSRDGRHHGDLWPRLAIAYAPSSRCSLHAGALGDFMQRCFLLRGNVRLGLSRGYDSSIPHLRRCTGDLLGRMGVRGVTYKLRKACSSSRRVRPSPHRSPYLVARTLLLLLADEEREERATLHAPAHRAPPAACVNNRQYTPRDALRACPMSRGLPSSLRDMDFAGIAPAVLDTRGLGPPPR